MISVQYEYAAKQFSLKPYNTKQEKSLLLMNTIGNNNTASALEICGIKKDVVDSLTANERLAMLYKLREISVGSSINTKFTCCKCSAPNENVIDIENMVMPGNITNEHIIDALDELTDDNIQKFYKLDIDELDIDEFEQVTKEINESTTKFSFDRPAICQQCTETNYINIKKDEFCINSLSEDTLISLYQTYSDLVFFGKYSLHDVDSMFPFERSILINILNKTREELTR